MQVCLFMTTSPSSPLWWRHSTRPSCAHLPLTLEYQVGKLSGASTCACGKVRGI